MSMRKRYPDSDPRSWGLPIAPQPTPAREVPAVSGHWVEDPHSPSGWTWSSDAAQAHSLPVPDHELGTPRRDTAMTQPEPDAGGLVAFDPDNPHDPTTSITEPSPAATATDPDIAVCHTCGSVVAAERLR